MTVAPIRTAGNGQEFERVLRRRGAVIKQKHDELRVAGAFHAVEVPRVILVAEPFRLKMLENIVAKLLSGHAQVVAYPINGTTALPAHYVPKDTDSVFIERPSKGDLDWEGVKSSCRKAAFVGGFDRRPSITLRDLSRHSASELSALGTPRIYQQGRDGADVVNTIDHTIRPAWAQQGPLSPQRET